MPPTGCACAAPRAHIRDTVGHYLDRTGLLPFADRYPYPMIINTTAGVLEIDRIYLDVGRNFGAGRWQTFRTIALPGAAPLIMAGMKLGAGLGLVLIAIAEMVGAQSGIGYMIWNAWQLMAVETMFVGLIVIAILGFAFNWALDELERWLLPWKARG